MTVKVLRVDTTSGSVHPALRETGQQLIWDDVLTPADIPSTLSSQRYVPTVTSSGAGTAGAIGQFTAHRIGNDVIVVGTLNFTPAVAGVAEGLTLTLPSTMLPTANFAAVTDVVGVTAMAGPVPATDGQAGPRATVGAKTATVLAVVANASRAIGVTLCYSVA